MTTTRKAPRLKWHRLRRRAGDSSFARGNLRPALEAGAAIEIDLVVTGDGDFLCIHDQTLDRETTGRGPVREATRAAIEKLRQRGNAGEPLDEPPLFFDEVVEAVRSVANDDGGLVQIDMKEPGDRLSDAEVASLAALLGDDAGRFVVSGTEWEPVQRLVRAAPGLRFGFDPARPSIAAGCPRMRRDSAHIAERMLATAPGAGIYYLEASLVLAALRYGVDLVALVEARRCGGGCLDARPDDVRPRGDAEGAFGARLRPDHDQRPGDDRPDDRGADGVLTLATVEAIEAPSAALRAELSGRPAGPAQHAEALGALPALHALEVSSPPEPAEPLTRPARIAFWNAERLKYGEASARLVRSLGADALLLAELDLGMARSGNRHTLQDLARAVGAGYVFGVEFVELGLGDARERRWHANDRNEHGLHGGGLLSAHPLLRPALLRLETSGRWFDGRLDERRIGGRIAVMAELLVMGRPVLLVAVHYESHTGPEDRLEQTRTMLDAIDDFAPGRPVLIGGDLNTNTFDIAKPERLALQAQALAEDPRRLVDPVRYEPMFSLLEERGYDWRDCNVAGAPTQRTRPDGTPAPPFGKIDWFLSRGLRCSAPAIVPATDAEGVAISDHEVLAVTVEPA